MRKYDGVRPELRTEAPEGNTVEMGYSERCPFCEKVIRDDYLRGYEQAVVFEPLNPVTPGHLLAVPRVHVENASSNPWVTAGVMRVAAMEARAVGDCNIITSVGEAATQRVFHLHIHVVPRHHNDGLVLPWTNQPALGLETP